MKYTQNNIINITKLGNDVMLNALLLMSQTVNIDTKDIKTLINTYIKTKSFIAYSPHIV